MSSAFISSNVDIARWGAAHRTAPKPGGHLPYGLGLLERGFDLTWGPGWLWKPPMDVVSRASDRIFRKHAPGLLGLWRSAASYARVRSADVVISMFEDCGLGLARLRSHSCTMQDKPLIIVACWLSDDCLCMSDRQLRSVGRSLAGASRVLVFSENQVSILQDVFSLEEGIVKVVPFGVDTNFYDASQATGPRGGGGVVAVGSDSRRDYLTLFEAVELSGVPVTLACGLSNLAGLRLPRNVRLVQGVYGDGYRELLNSADLVVTLTTAPAYPSGQSVVLEAMSMGIATLTTDSVAMRDYVVNGCNGILVEPKDPIAVASAMRGLLEDSALRTRLGEAGRRIVRESYSLESLWLAVERCVDEIVV